MALRHSADQAFAAPATAAQPNHLGIGGGLVDEHKVHRIKHALFSHPTPACPRHIHARSCSAACTLFFESNLVTLEEAPDCRAAARNPVLAHYQNHFVQCQIRLLLNQTEQKICMLI